MDGHKLKIVFIMEVSDAYICIEKLPSNVFLFNVLSLHMGY